MQELAEASQRAKRIHRAVSVATVNGWTIGAFAALSLLMAAVSAAIDTTRIDAWALSVGMAIVAFFEFQGVLRLRRLDPAAGRRLGFNQLGFALLLIAYAAYNLQGTPNSKELDEITKLDPQMGKMIGSLYSSIRLALYGSLIAVAVLVQGGNAWFYFSRTKYIRAYLENTPPWIVQLQQSGVRLL